MGSKTALRGPPCNIWIHLAFHQSIPSFKKNHPTRLASHEVLHLGWVAVFKAIVFVVLLALALQRCLEKTLQRAVVLFVSVGGVKGWQQKRGDFVLLVFLLNFFGLEVVVQVTF